MKKFLLTFFVITASLHSQAQWMNQNLSLPYEGYIFDIQTVDANTVWGALWNTTSGLPTQYTPDFVRTVDGGTTWTYGTIAAPGLAISNIWPLSADTCFVAMCNVTAGGGAIYKTTDGGVTWTQNSTPGMYSQATSFCNIVYFSDPMNGFAQGDPVGTGANQRFELWTTADGGNTWTQVPVANIPALTNAGEYGITNLFSAIGNHIWFATTYGDVYHSADKGLTWTKSATGLPPYTASGNRQDITDIAFCDSLHGMVVQVNASNFIIKTTADGGATWNNLTPSGNFYPTEIEGIPGTSIFLSGSSNTTYGFASSFSTDYGLTWTDLDNGASHTSFDFINDSTGYGGEYLALGNPGGAWKFNGTFYTPSIACGDPSISSGISVINNPIICWDSTLVFTTTGITAPTVGTVHGYSTAVSQVPITNNPDPVGAGLVIASTGVLSIPPNGSNTTNLKNDGAVLSAGVYFVSPVVYGNATGAGSFFALTLDPNCTYTGQSVQVTLLAQGSSCPVGIAEHNPSSFAVTAAYPVPVKESLSLVVESGRTSPIDVKITDLAGREITSFSASIKSGSNTVSINTQNLTSGIYFVTVSNSSQQVTKQFVKD
ncbi:MAG: T9SS type A sorting domain-containing protein [Bacteroidia bacterium]|nr:T9SS type A sorting domain-containing protein [Bacteroidia bacterium]MCZ2277652.1 T9SS type A sorting domain-containing protein [Bacteroidia bacterium]